MDKPQVTTLENGLKVVTLKMPTLQIYADVTVNVGFRHEKPEECGISHFLEHMVASDTQRMDHEEAEVAIDNMRGIMNASTGEERTNYWLRVSNAYQEDAIQMLSDYIIRPKFDETILAKERESIKQEFASYASNPGSIQSYLSSQVCYPGTQLDNDVFSSHLSIIDGQDSDTLKAYMQKHYTADNMVLAVVGDVDHEQICDMARKHFADLKPTADVPREEPPFAKYRGGMLVKDSLEQEQTSFTMSFEAPGGRRNKASSATDSITSSILGGGFSSPLLKTLRTELGLVYSAGAYANKYPENGTFNIYAETGAKNLPEAIDAICEEINKFADSITEEEVETARNKLIGSAERSIESVSGLGGALATRMAVDKELYDVEATIDNWNNVTVDDVKARIKEVFASPPAIAAYGKDATKYMPSYEEITRKLGKERTLDATGLVVENAPSADRAVGDAQITAQPQQAKQHSRVA